MARFFGQFTMYRLLLYGLVLYWLMTIGLSALGVLPYSPWHLFAQGCVLGLVSWGTNTLCARLTRVVPNPESFAITALILTLILGPLQQVSDWPYFVVAAIAAMASKYVIAPRKHHLFNPAAFGAVVAGLAFGTGASWWIADPLLLVPTVVLGVVITTKTRRWDLVLAFLIPYAVWSVGSAIVSDRFVTVLDALRVMRVEYAAIIFFATIMLVEPATSPTTRVARMVYRASLAVFMIVFLSVLPNQLTGFSPLLTLEGVLLLGNGAVWLSRRTARTTLRFTDKHELAPNIWQFTFAPTPPLQFRAGQYLEWTLPHSRPDDRGIRRYFTIASSPKDTEVQLITKMATERSSTFKEALLRLKPGDRLTAGPPEGEFTLPRESNRPIVFIAGGIGITPYLSMLQYLLDTKQKRHITLVYGVRTPDECVGSAIITAAEKRLGLKTVYVAAEAPRSWPGRIGRIDEALIREAVPDYQKAQLYISGPEPMVIALTKLFCALGVARRSIRRDYFPGYSDKA